MFKRLDGTVLIYAVNLPEFGRWGVEQSKAWGVNRKITNVHVFQFEPFEVLLRSERQSARMSEIKTGGLDQYGKA